MNAEAAKIVHRTAAVTAGIGALLSPIPLLDELVLFPVYADLARRIGRSRGLPASELPWRPVLRTAFNGLLARAGLNLAVSYIPGVAAVANAASAALLTELFGRFADEACAAPKEAAPVGVKAIASLLRDQVARWRPGAAADAPPAA